MTYHEIKSGYIRELIQTTSWTSHENIDNLIRMHAFLLNPPTTLNGGILFNWLKSSYPDHYLSLLKEISMEEYEKEIVRQQERLAAQLKSFMDLSAKEDLARKDWLNAGGQS
jgi:hypothetical protein